MCGCYCSLVALLSRTRGVRERGGTQVAVPAALDAMVRLDGVFKPAFGHAYRFVGRKTAHERAHGFARPLQLRVALVVLAAVDVREREDERLCGPRRFLLRLSESFRRPGARPFRRGRAAREP